jgi:hypothetical protein
MMRPDTTCGLTVIEAAAPGVTLAKTWRTDGTCEAYGHAKRVNLLPHTLPDFEALAGLLEGLAGHPRRCVVRGAVADPDRVREVRRLLHPDRDTGEAPTLRDVPRRWCALDMDAVPLPASVSPENLERCARHALALLPPAWQVAQCIVQATAGHGFKPGARLRLWFWLSRLTRGDELAAWLRGRAVDASVFRAAQPIYTAAPIFEGRADPLPRRLATLPGATAVEVPSPALLSPPRPPSRSHAMPRTGDGARALDYARRVIAGQREGARHDTALQMAGWLAGLASRGEVQPEAVAAAIAEGLAAAGKDRSEGEAIARFVLAREGFAG